MYSISENISDQKIFLLNRSDLEGRLEPKYYTQKYLDNEHRLRQSKFPLKLLCEVTALISDGTHFTPEYIDSGVKFISVKDVRKSRISLEKVKYISTEEADKLDKRCKPQKNDVLLTKIGTYGYAALVETNERFQIFVSLALLRPNNEINPKYLEIFLNTDLAFIQYERIIKGAGVPDLHLEDIRRIKIPVPSKEIQLKIVEIYETAFNEKQRQDTMALKFLSSIDGFLLESLGIKLSAKNNTLKNRIFKISKGNLNERLDPIYYHSDLTKFNKGSYENIAIGIVAHQLKSGFGAGKQDQAIGENGIIQIRPTNVDENGILKYDRNIYLPSELQGIADTIEVGDVLFNNTNSQDLVGKTAILEEKRELFYSNHITKIKVNKDLIVPKYLWAILNTYQRHRIFYSICTNWNNQSGVGLELLKTVKIPCPPLDKQKKIVIHIEDMLKRSLKLKTDANKILEDAKRKVEKFILG